MSWLPTFYLAPQEWFEPFTLKGQDYHHLIKVLRAKPKDQLKLINGQGVQGIFEVDSVLKNKVILSKIRTWFEPKRHRQTYLAAGWNKALRRTWLLEKSVELEATGIYFWQAARSQGQMPSAPKPAWNAQLVSGAKQCANPWLPEIRTFPQGIEELIKDCRHFDQFIFLWEDENSEQKIELANLKNPGKTLIVIGPEGGFAEKEINCLLHNNYKAASLGKRILRWETAALVCLGLAWFAQDNSDPEQSITNK